MSAARQSWVRYLVTWLVLVALAVLSLCLSFLHIGDAFVAVSLVIATAMATVSMTSFMHLEGERFSIRMVPLAVVFFVGLLLALVAVDVATRTTFPRAPVPSVGEIPAE